MVHDDNAVTQLAEAVSRIGTHEFPVVITDTVRALVEAIAEVTGLDLDPDDPTHVARRSSAAMARMIGATIRNTANPTMLTAGLQGQRHPVARRGR